MGLQSVSGCHHITMSDCEETTEIDSVRSRDTTESGDPEAGHDIQVGGEEKALETDEEKSQENEEPSVGNLVVHEAEIELTEPAVDNETENDTDNKPSIADGCGLEFNEERITVDDSGSKDEPADLDPTETPCTTIETENVNEEEELNEVANEEELNEVVNEEESKSDEVEISDDERAMMVNMFKHFDSDGTGAMSIAELGNFMRAIGMFPTDDEVDDLLTHMDQDKSGMVDQEELIRQMSHQLQIRKEMDPEHDFKEAFLLFDKDGNGKISREELTDVLTNHGRMKVSLEEAGDYIAMVDTDSDGMLDYSEFVNLFTTKIGL